MTAGDAAGRPLEIAASQATADATSAPDHHLEDSSAYTWSGSLDALIVAAAQRAGCEFLLTEDLADGRPIDSITVVNPFTHDPPAGGGRSAGNG